MRRMVLISIFLLVLQSARAQNSFKQNPDSNRIAHLIKLGDSYTSNSFDKTNRAVQIYNRALILSTHLPSPYWKNIIFLKLSIQYAKLQDLRKSRLYYKQVLNYYESHKDLKNLSKTYAFLQRNLWVGDNKSNAMYDEAVLLLEQKRVVDIKLKDTLSAILDLKNIGDIHLNEGKLDLSENELLKVVDLYKAIHYKNIHHTYYLLSAVSHLKGDLHKELFYGIEAVKGMVATNDTSYATARLFYYELARTYQDIGLYNKSIPYFEKLIVSLKAQHMDYMSALVQIVEAMINQNKPIEALRYFQNQTKTFSVHTPDGRYFYNKGMAICYQALGQNHATEHFLLEMIKDQIPHYASKGQTYEMHVKDYQQVAQFYLKINNYHKARYYLEKAMVLPKDNVSAITLSQLQFLSFRVDSAFGNYVSAIQHFEFHKKLADSIFNATKSRQIADLQINYETEQKDKDILLLKKQSIIEQGKFKQKRTIGNLLIAGVILLLALLAVLYNRYLLKQRNIVLLKDKQKEISGKNRKLERLLHDNEWLLKEVHHRVKNNLHIVMSLLHSQSTYLKDQVALNAVLDSQHRVHAMSLIHQKLYKSANATTVYMPEYIGELVDYLKDSFKTGLRVLFRLEIEPVMMDVLQAVPVGLILNEIITNSIKYAFPFTENDSIVITLFHTEEGNIQLRVSDNGRGMPDGFDIDHNDSFGILLMKGLIEDLSGTFLLESSNGTTVTLNFNITRATEQTADLSK